PPPFARLKMTADDINPYILSPDEHAQWKDRIASARNDGLFTPPGLKETVSLPGARGGSNWGSTAANPSKGLMYLATQDWPTLYKLRLEDPLGGRSRGGGGRAAYEERCQGCHGVRGAGSGVSPPPIAGAGSPLGFEAFRQIVLGGRAEMPGFPDLDNDTLTSMLEFLGEGAAPTAKPESRRSSGPVVASGGAPGGLEIQTPTGPRYSPLGGPPYA